MKLCTKCKIVEIVSGSWCSECKKSYLKNYKENHKSHLNELTKQWTIKNREAHREVKYNYYASLKGRIQNMVKGARKRAKQKNIECTVDIDWITEQMKIQNNKCALTKIDFDIPTERNSHKASPFAPSLDRIDSNRGYTKDNVRIVCVAVNYALNEFGEEVFKQICTAYLTSVK